MTQIVFYNGEFMPREDVRISFEDRGFQFGDGVYEVIKCEQGQALALDRHLRRLKRSLDALEILIPSDLDFAWLTRHLIDANSLHDGLIYMQVTRGVAPRAHAFPEGAKPTVIAYPMHWNSPTPVEFERGATAIIVPDERWLRCDIKSLNLIANAMAKEKARRAGVTEALLYREGLGVLEGSSSNFFAVIDGTLVTAPASPFILGGITREIILELAAELEIPLRTEGISREELLHAQESFITSRGIAVYPLVAIDSKLVADGKPGPITKQLASAYQSLIDEAGNLEAI